MGERESVGRGKRERERERSTDEKAPISGNMKHRRLAQIYPLHANIHTHTTPPPAFGSPPGNHSVWKINKMTNKIG